MFCGENMKPAKVAVRCWSHAGALMQCLEDKVEARDIAQRFEVTQAPNISGFAITMGYSALDAVSESYGLDTLTYHEKPVTCIQ